MSERTLTAEKSGKHIIRAKILSQAEGTTRISDSIARRAYEIFESRGSVPGHDREHWLLAESELLRPLCCGILEMEDKVHVGTDVSVFNAHEVEVCVEPHRLIVVGKSDAKEVPESTNLENHEGKLTYGVCSLPAEVNPSHIRVKVNGPILEIVMHKAAAAKERASFAKAA